jgi:outer membrane protein TolC
MNRLRPLKIICFLLLLSAGPAYALEQPEKILSLEDSIKWAMTNNQDLLLLAEKKYIYEQKIQEADSYFYPKLVLSGAYTRLDVSTPTTFPPNLGGSTLPVGVSNHYATRVSVNQYLFTGGYLINQHMIAETQLEEIRKDDEGVKRGVVLDVAAKFYDVLYQQQLLDIYKEYQAQLKNYLDIARRKTDPRDYETGLWEMEAANLEALLSKTEEKADLALIAFNKSVGFELNSKVKLVGDLKVTGDEGQQDINTYVAKALDCSPELQRLALVDTEIQYEISQAFSERYPTIVLGADYERSGLDFDLAGRNWTATLAINYPLFNGWLSWARVRQMRGELKRSSLMAVQQRDNLTLQVQQSYSHYLRAGKNLNNLGRNKDLAQKTLDAVVESYKTHRVSCTDVLTVQRRYLDTKMLYLDESYEYTLSEIELKVATGIDLSK